MLIRRQPKRPRKRPTQQKTICEAECWAALLVVGILVLFCLTCIIHDYV
ncbi:1565_t:CDS:1, partial [Dentiscutata heterogama]